MFWHWAIGFLFPAIVFNSFPNYPTLHQPNHSKPLSISYFNKKLCYSTTLWITQFLQVLWTLSPFSKGSKGKLLSHVHMPPTARWHMPCRSSSLLPRCLTSSNGINGINVVLQLVWCIYTPRKTNRSPLKIGNPKSYSSIPTIHFQGQTVSFRLGNAWPCHVMGFPAMVFAAESPHWDPSSLQYDPNKSLPWVFLGPMAPGVVKFVG